jgi:hypothetical protein
MYHDLQRDELAAMIKTEEQVWVREVWSIEENGEERIRFVEASLGHKPPTWIENDWRYEQAIFRARITPGAQLADWIDRVHVDVPNDLSWPARFTRRRSGDLGPNETLNWPADEWRSPFAAQRNSVIGELVPGTGPTFRSFDLGVANHLGLVHRLGWALPSPEFVVRRQDRRARISSVFVGSSAIEAVVEGDDLAGATLEVAGDLPGPFEDLDAMTPRKVTFESDLPPQPWLVLRRDGRMLDARRQLQRPPLGVEGEWGVTWEAPPDPTDNSPFSRDEQEHINTAILAIKFKIATELPPGPSLENLQALLDSANEKKTWLGRIDWRTCIIGSLIELLANHAVTEPHARLVWGLLRVGLAQLHGTVLPALPGLDLPALSA